MANPTEAPVAAAAPSVSLPGHGPPPGGIPGPLPESPAAGTSAAGAGVLGQSNLGPGVHGQSVFSSGVANSGQSDGVLGDGKNGVHGVSLATTGAGVLGEHKVGGQGVLGTSVSGEGVVGIGRNGVHGQSASPTDSGVWGENTGSGYGVAGSSTGSGYGVAGISAHGNGVIGLAAGVAPPAGVNNNGVIGVTNTATDSGVWGNNTGSGYGVAGSSTNGNGVIGLAAGAPTGGGTVNGVIGRTTSESASGVWGDNTGSGFGVTGSSTNGIGVLGQGGRLAGRFEGTVEISGLLHCAGNINLTSSTGDITLANQDCAEDFEMVGAGQIDPGSVVVIDLEGAFKQSDRPYDKRVAGVVSGAGDCKPGIVLGRQQLQANTRPVALVGKVFCKADAGYSPIEVGDLLTTSPTPGHAMRVGDHVQAFGAVIGKALRSLGAGRELIPILVALQ